jgi:hypothetical protein
VVRLLFIANRGVGVSAIFIFISVFSRYEKSDFEQLFKIRFVSAILFFRFYSYFVFYH